MQMLNMMSRPTSTIKIILVDDHSILLDGIESLLNLEKDFNVVNKFGSGEDLLASEETGEIDVLVMDINMRGVDGIQTFSQLVDRGFKASVIFLTTYDDLRLVNEAVDLGAKGYITKGSASKYLVEAIRQVSEGELYYSPDIKDKILKAFSRKSTIQDDDQQEAGFLRQLTERELDVLKLIAQEYTSEAIANKLYIAKSTVDTHRKNLINKLKVKNAVGLGLFAERNGLI